MRTPTHLEHRPIIAVDDYDILDGPYANNTDAQALSLGKAQYDGAEVSLKVFRNPNGRWSRQSEELPPHRAMDLTILLLASILRNNYNTNVVSFLNERIENQAELHDVIDYYNANRHIIDARINELRRLLSNFP